ncbi:hypothetical protein HR51_21755 [Burkholderia cepacia]|nr:hypothetical protein HR51_21755 [Burkholderia cepacia]
MAGMTTGFLSRPLSSNERILDVLRLEYGVRKIRQQKGNVEVTGANNNAEHCGIVCVTRRKLTPLINIDE